MYFLIYSSDAVFEFHSEDLKALLLQAQRKNLTVNVSGMLIYSGGKFIQLIEGEEQAVKSLYVNICKDKRHQNIKTLKEDTVDTRFFADWSMGFKSLAVEDMDGIAGFNDLYAQGGFNLTSALHLFEIFSKNRIPPV